MWSDTLLWRDRVLVISKARSEAQSGKRGGEKLSRYLRRRIGGAPAQRPSSTSLTAAMLRADEDGGLTEARQAKALGRWPGSEPAPQPSTAGGQPKTQRRFTALGVLAVRRTRVICQNMP